MTFLMSYPCQSQAAAQCHLTSTLLFKSLSSASSAMPRNYFSHTFYSSVMTLLRSAGLLGGHSGLNIAEGRGNAVKMAAEILHAIFTVYPEARLAQLNAGDKRNAFMYASGFGILICEQAGTCSL